MPKTPKEIVLDSMGPIEKLSALKMVWWAKENGMQVIGTLLQNVWGAKVSTMIGMAILAVGGMVMFYCSTDATGGWIDPNCAMLTKYALLASGLGHVLAPGYLPNGKQGG